MSSDFQTYEQDFGTITAEVTNKIGKIPKLSGEEKTQLVLNVDKQLEEVRELLYPGPGRGGSRLSRDTQTSLSPDTSSSSSGGSPRRSQASREI
ncbi:hypothetical protein ILYODFUR_007656 [Ilyodon furcidens]|uniref:Vesicle transport v-SNARE N-terminal domain-containing protein n=1 Tax=Ilyodon furcidens TaxID=33524 RepID=A0ABV0URC7_9TELE